MWEKRRFRTAYGSAPSGQVQLEGALRATVTEMTMLSLIIGAIFAMLFAATNTYLGLKVGMTVSASVPGSVLGTALFRGIFRRNHLLEINIAQATGSTGESIASGVMFTLPALLIWGFTDQFTLLKVASVATVGTILGVLCVIPLRRNLTIDEQGVLPYPEGMATAQILIAGKADATSARGLIWGTVIGGIYKISSGALGVFREEIEWKIPGILNGIFGFDTLASLLGVGFIVGMDIGLYMFAGGILAWLVLIPMIAYFGAGVPLAIFPSTIPISQMDAWGIWSKYIRYIGAGAVAAGGFISLVRSLPMIILSVKAMVRGQLGRRPEKNEPQNQDLAPVVIFFGVFSVFICAVVVPQIHVSFVGAAAIVILGFFFSAVSARVVGIVGVSNLPVSGMTIAALLVSTVLLKTFGIVDNAGMIASITTGAVICIAISVAGSLAQNLKAGQMIGATPKFIQIGMIVGGIMSTVVVASVILMLHQAYGIGSEKLAAPQATLMSLVVAGVMSGTLPWDLVISGIVIGVILALLKLPVLPIGIGIYLPLHLSTGILAGSIVRWAVDQGGAEATLKEKVEQGILFSSGLIAGDSLMGIVIAFFAYLGWSDKIAIFATLPLAANAWWGFGMFVLLALILYRFTIKSAEME